MSSNIKWTLPLPTVKVFSAKVLCYTVHMQFVYLKYPKDYILYNQSLTSSEGKLNLKYGRMFLNMYINEPDATATAVTMTTPMRGR